MKTRRIEIAVLSLFLILSFLQEAAFSAVRRTTEWKTFAVLSLTDSETGLKSLKRAAEAAGHLDLVEEQEKEFRSAFEPFYDFTKPRGLIAQSSGSQVHFYAFAPFKNLEKCDASFLGRNFTTASKNSEGWFEFPIESTPLTVYIKEQNGWTFATLIPPNKSVVLPEDPSVLLEGLDKEHFLALKIDFENVPTAPIKGGVIYVKQLLPTLQFLLQGSGMDMGEQQERFFKEYLKLLGAIVDGTGEMLVRGVKESRSSLCTLNLNENDDLVLRSVYECKPGTQTAELLKKYMEAKTDHIGFYRPEDSVLTLNAVGFYSTEDQKFLGKLTKSYFSFYNSMLSSEEMREAFEDDEETGNNFYAWLQDAMKVYQEIVEKTLAMGKMDLSETVLSSGSLLISGTIADGKKFEPVIESGFELFQKSLSSMGEAFEIEIAFKKEDYKGMKLWSLDIPFGESFAAMDEEVVPEVIKKLRLCFIVALNDSRFAYAYGITPNLSDVLKKAIDDSQNPAAVPKDMLIFSPREIGTFFKTYEYFGMESEPLTEVMEMLGNLPKDANMVVNVQYNGTKAESNMVMSGKLWAPIGKLVELYLTFAPSGFSINLEEGEITVEENTEPIDVDEKLADFRNEIKGAKTIAEVEELISEVETEARDIMMKGNSVEAYIAYMEMLAKSHIEGSEKILGGIAQNDEEKLQGYTMKIRGLRSLANAQRLSAGPPTPGQKKPVLAAEEDLKVVFEELEKLGGIFVVPVNDEKYSTLMGSIGAKLSDRNITENTLGEIVESAKEASNLEPKSEHPSASFTFILDRLLRNPKYSEDSAAVRKVADGFIAFFNSDASTASEEQKKESIGRIEGFFSRLPGGELKLYGKTIENKDFDWDSYRGKYVLVKFTASWCGPCKGEIPGMLKAYKNYHEKGFEIVSVGVWDENKNLVEMMEHEKLPWTMISEELSTAAGFSGQGDHYGIRGVPTMLLIDKEGKVLTTEIRGAALGKKLGELLD